MTEEQRDLLCRGLTRLGVPYTPEAVERLGLYCRRLLEKNQVMNLTAITDPADVMTLHFLDSAALLPTRALGGRKLIDVGTGLPGSGRHAHAGGAVPALCQARRPLSGHEEQQDR